MSVIFIDSTTSCTSRHNSDQDRTSDDQFMLAKIYPLLPVLQCAPQVVITRLINKVENILKGSLDSIPSHSPLVNIQIMGGKVCSSCKGKTFLGVVNKSLITRSLLTSTSNVFPYYLK